MATTAETLSHIKSIYRTEEVGSSGILKAVFETDDGRSQVVFLFVDEYKIQIASPFAKTSQITDAQAFEVSLDSPFGVGKLADFYVVRNTVQIADLDPSEVTIGVELTMLIADGFEKELGLGDDL